MWMLRQAQSFDLKSILMIQSICYSSEYWEDQDSLLSKINTYPDCTWVVEDEMGMGAYFICILSSFKTFPQLNTISQIIDNPDLFYCHDMAILPRLRKQGIAEYFIEKAQDTALQKGFNALYLVAVSGADWYWVTHGFQVGNPEYLGIGKQVNSFGEKAQLMIRNIEQLC